MAEIICNFDDFNKYIGPRVRNVIQSMTKKPKKELYYKCQRCKKKKSELEAAHIKGSSRKDILKSLLNKYIIDRKNELYKVDLDKFEIELKKYHQPISKHFLFLCPECHREYDSE